MCFGAGGVDGDGLDTFLLLLTSIRDARGVVLDDRKQCREPGAMASGQLQRDSGGLSDGFDGQHQLAPPPILGWGRLLRKAEGVVVGLQAGLEAGEDLPRSIAWTTSCLVEMTWVGLEGWGVGSRSGDRCDLGVVRGGPGST